MKIYQFKAAVAFEFELKDLTVLVKNNRRMTGVPHRVAFYQIIRIQKGCCTPLVDFQPVPLKEGELLFIGKNQVITFDVESEYVGQIILFTDHFYNRCECEARFLQQTTLFNPFTINAPLPENHSLRTVWELMEEEYKGLNARGKSDLLHNLLATFLGYAGRLKGEEPDVKNRDYEIAFNFVQAVDLHFPTYRKVNEYADLLGISSKTITRALKSILGRTPKQQIEERILLEAKRMLVYSNSTIKEITWALGFEEPTNFSKFFRESAGMTPNDFRKEYTA